LANHTEFLYIVAMTPIRALISDTLDDDEPTMFLGSNDGEFDEAIVGITRRDGVAVLVYDTEKVIDCLTKDGTSVEDAWDWYFFNIEGAYMGPGTPMYITTMKTLREQH